MAKISVKCVDGSTFEYDDRLKETYRIKQADGTIRLKIESCPEITICNKQKPKKIRSLVVDAYVVISLDPDALLSNTSTLLNSLRREFSYLDAYLTPATEVDAVKYGDSGILYDEEYNSQGFILILAGEKGNGDVKYYLDNMVGGLTINEIQSWSGNLTCRNVFDDTVNVVYDVASIPHNGTVKNRGSAGVHKDMTKKIARRLGLSCTAFSW